MQPGVSGADPLFICELLCGGNRQWISGTQGAAEQIVSKLIRSNLQEGW